MIAQIVLDQKYTNYTNLDVISGKVFVRTPSSVNVSSIVVKLEGESRTRLLPPVREDGERPRPVLEHHKILYKTQVVFPPAAVVDAQQGKPNKSAYSLPAGQHEFPFSFKIPFNNACYLSKGAMPNLSFGGMSILPEISRPPTRHVKQTLPPTLTGFPGEAEIKYYVKATVGRPTLFKENPRAYAPFNFLPIERPRPPPTDAETYARRRYQFGAPISEHAPTKGKMKSLFGSKQTPSPPGTPKEAPYFSFDVRLPEPAILTCNEAPPIRLIFTALNQYREGVSLQSLQIELIGYTHVRAHDVIRTETMQWVLVSRTNMGMRVNYPKEGKEAVIDGRIWGAQPLPKNVAPSFNTCNISRTYELITRVGVRYEIPGAQKQYTTMELKLPVEVFSGIAPPRQLLESMGLVPRSTAVAASNSTANLKPAPQPTTTSEPTTPGPSASLPDRKPVMPPRPAVAPASSTQPEAPPPEYSEAPPSYEDAIAQDLPPVEGPRREYAPPAALEDDPMLRDEKRGWH